MLNKYSYICARAKIERDINKITYQYRDQIIKCKEATDAKDCYLFAKDRYLCAEDCYLSAEADYEITAEHATIEYSPEVYHEYRSVREENLHRFVQARNYLDIIGHPDADEMLRDFNYLNMLDIPERLMDRLDTKYKYGKIEKFLGECFCEK